MRSAPPPYESDCEDEDENTEEEEQEDVEDYKKGSLSLSWCHLLTVTVHVRKDRL